MILAEVEGPELSALLGFVYTGSASIPRTRLDEFLRAAETLRIRLPPLPSSIRDVDQSPQQQHQQHPDHTATKRSPQDSKSQIARIHQPQPAAPVTPQNHYQQHQTPHHHPYQYTAGWLWSSSAVAGIDGHRSELTVNDGRGAATSRAGLAGLSFERVGPAGLRLWREQQASGTPEEAARDYSRSPGEPGECRDSCCKWRPQIPGGTAAGGGGRTAVANQVIASPWKQIVRPYHAPKLASGVPRIETADVPPELPFDATSSCVPQNQCCASQPTDLRSVHYHPEQPQPQHQQQQQQQQQQIYGPTLTDLTVARPVPLMHQDRAFGAFYDVSSGNCRQQLPVSLYHPSIAAPYQMVYAAEVGPPVLAKTEHQASARENGQISLDVPVHQTRPKTELSHPVSRLCDSLDDHQDPIDEDTKGSSQGTCGDDEASSKPGSHAFSLGSGDSGPLDKNGGVLLGVRELNILSDDNNNSSEAGNNEAGTRSRRISGGSVTGQDDHRCEQCGKTFVTRASLKVHSRTHSGEKPFRCADCGKQFSQLRNYKYHRSVHEGTREFAATCPECGKYFNDRGYLSSHMKIHRNRKEYGCTECGKSFNQRVAYNMHVRIHTGVKPHQCEQCGKAFSRKMLLKQHLRTHSGERPYQCQVCHKAFADRSNMTLHTRLHSGLKPYQCTLCSKAFTKKHHLKTHLNYHTGTKPYSCPNCDLRFSQSSNMRTHYKKCALTNNNNNSNNNNNNNSEKSNGSVNHHYRQRSSSESLPIQSNPEIGGRRVSTTSGTTTATTVSTPMVNNPPTTATSTVTRVILTPPNSDQESNHNNNVTSLVTTIPVQPAAALTLLNK